MANNAQPPAIANAIFDAVGVWVTEMPGDAGARARAIEAKREPRRDGKRVIFDEASRCKTSRRTAAQASWTSMPGTGSAATGRSAPGTGAIRSSSSTACALHAIGGEQVLLCRVEYQPGKQVTWHAHEDTEQVMSILEGCVEMTIGRRPRRSARRRRRRQPRAAAQALLRGRRHLHGGARTGAARPRPRSAASTSSSARTAAPSTWRSKRPCPSSASSCSNAG